MLQLYTQHMVAISKIVTEAKKQGFTFGMTYTTYEGTEEDFETREHLKRFMNADDFKEFVQRYHVDSMECRGMISKWHLYVQKDRVTHYMNFWESGGLYFEGLDYDDQPDMYSNTSDIVFDVPEELFSEEELKWIPYRQGIFLGCFGRYLEKLWHCEPITSDMTF